MDPASSTLVSFVGDPQLKLDDKNRITIPSAWRRIAATKEWLLVPDRERHCLLVMTPPAFAAAVSKAHALTTTSELEVRKFLRLLHARTRHGAPDTQGRLVLPPDFCEEFQLTGEVILVGNEGRFEVWNVDRWQQTAAADEAIFDHVGNLIGL